LLLLILKQQTPRLLVQGFWRLSANPNRRGMILLHFERAMLSRLKLKEPKNNQIQLSHECRYEGAAQRRNFFVKEQLEVYYLRYVRCGSHCPIFISNHDRQDIVSCWLLQTGEYSQNKLFELMDWKGKQTIVTAHAPIPLSSTFLPDPESC